MDELIKLNSSVKASENSFKEEEKKTISIRLTESTIEKIGKRVEELKRQDKMSSKYTSSSYLSKILEDFVRGTIDSNGKIIE